MQPPRRSPSTRRRPGTDVEFTLGHIIANVVVQGAELLMGWWSEIGVDVDDVTIPQNDFINQAVLRVPGFEVFSWRHNGVWVDQQYLWWHSENAFLDGSCRSTSAGCAIQTSTPSMPRAGRRPTRRRSPRPRTSTGCSPRQCYYIPLNWIPGVLTTASVRASER